MFLPKKPLVASTLVLSLGLTGCSTISGMFGSDDGYRDTETKTVAALEMPPKLINPAREENAAYGILDKQQASPATTAAVVGGGQMVANMATIPTYKAAGLQVKSNFSERWLEISHNHSQAVWQQLQNYLVSLGFEIKEQREDIGVIKTAYLPRKEIVPISDQGPLTKLFNSWRDQTAEGIYDKLILRVEQKDNLSPVKVYFAHNMMYSPEAENKVGDESFSSWTLKQSSPMMEAEAMYQALVFLGSTQANAIQKMESTVKTVSVLDGEEFAGLNMHAGFDEVWSHLQTSIYRANWDIALSNRSKGELLVTVPEDLRKDDSFLSAIVFWKSENKGTLPETVKIIAKSATPNSTVVAVQRATEDTPPLTPDQRKLVFESLGLTQGN